MAFIFAEESASSAEMDAFLIVKKERKRMKKEKVRERKRKQEGKEK